MAVPFIFTARLRHALANRPPRYFLPPLFFPSAPTVCNRVGDCEMRKIKFRTCSYTIFFSYHFFYTTVQYYRAKSAKVRKWSATDCFAIVYPFALCFRTFLFTHFKVRKTIAWCSIICPLFCKKTGSVVAEKCVCVRTAKSAKKVRRTKCERCNAAVVRVLLSLRTFALFFKPCGLSQLYSLTF